MLITWVLVLLGCAYNLVEGQDVQCPLPKVTGSCRLSLPRFYFNSEAGRCESFNYGGCGGNENNFKTLKECHDRCNSENEVELKGDHCKLPPVSPEGEARCMALIPKFTFNPQTLACERYMYGGCFGTANLFSTVQECFSSCIHGEIGSRVNRPRFRSPLFRGGPGSNAHTNKIIFPNWVDDETPICEQAPVHDGPFACTDYSQKWTFDQRQGKCVEFTYGGCRGSKNNFESLGDCQASCDKTARNFDLSNWQQPSRCSGPAVNPNSPASCLANLRLWTYNEGRQRCIQVPFGGCGKLENAFETESECVKTCDLPSYEEPNTLEVCSLPIAIGPCKVKIPSYGYNPVSKRCEHFFYGGCGGNGNRFSSVEDCVNVCGGFEPETDSRCAFVTCPREISEINVAKGCIPIIKENECCPSSWDCSRWEERLSHLDKCFLVSQNHPRGKFYNFGDIIREADRDCYTPTCGSGNNGKATVNIIAAGCGFFSKCSTSYRSHFQCCPTPNCEASDTCTIEGQTVVEGDRYYSKKDPCKVCLCKRGENGNVEANCVQRPCDFVMDSHLLIRGCIPVYNPAVCCASEWVCPEDKELEVPKALPLPKDCLPNSDGSSSAEECVMLGTPLAVCPNGHPIDTEVFKSFGEPGPFKSKDDCLLPKETGPCEGLEDGIYYDSASKKCDSFKYGGDDNAKGGQNAFESLKQCEEICADFIQNEDTNIAHSCETKEEDQPTLSGLCFPFRRKFRYNPDENQCEAFMTGLCKNGQNRYESKQDCEQNCLPKSPQVLKSRTLADPTCSLPPLTGNCRGRVRRFYFDSENNECKLFMFTGCHGNANNFKTVNECLESCDPRESRTISTSSEPPLNSDPCQQEKVIGPCKVAIPGFYYDKDSQSCKLFFYGGCRGNNNNFASVDQCMKTCDVSAEKQIAGNPCKLQTDAGPCEALIPRWTYSKEVQKCVLFYYGGCKGNGNNFKFKGECELTCSSEPQTIPQILLNKQVADSDENVILDEGGFADPCILDILPGELCHARLPKYGFNFATKRCESFIYSGCHGNANNFATSEACEKVCARHMDNSPKRKNTGSGAASKPLRTPVCGEPVDIGHCRGSMPRYTYDRSQDSCLRFLYSGCGGNGNRFHSERDCYSTCNPDVLEGTDDENVKKDAPVCTFGSDTYALGDIIVPKTGDSCTTCTCSSPPYMSCSKKDCPAIFFIVNGKNCSPVYDKDGCCQTGLACDKLDSCLGVRCLAISLALPPNSPAYQCTAVDNNCCEEYMKCVPRL